MPDSAPNDPKATRPAAWRRWAEAQPILDAVLDAPHGDRSRVLAAACASDPELLTIVADLLRHAEQSDSLLAGDAVDSFPHLVSELLQKATPEEAREPGGNGAAGGDGAPGSDIDVLRAALADRYRVERKVGAGGMATVYLALDVRHDRRVALKVLRPELSAVIGASRFLSEIKTTAGLQHPHILPLHDSGQVSGTVYYVMPYVEGESLRNLLRREKQLPIDAALIIARAVAGALEYAHRKGIVHRDIKPENILMQDGQALVADFGIALAAAAGGTRMTESGLSLGTPTYMSPEQAMGHRNLDGRTDIYSLACVLYEMLTGEPPFTGPTAQAIFAKVVTTRPVRPRALRDTIPRNVEEAILTGLHKLPADRFASAADFAAALELPAGHRPESPRLRVRLLGRAIRSPRTRVVPLAVLAFLGAWGWLRPRQSAPAPQLTRFSIALDETPGAPQGAVSPNGWSLVHVGTDAQATWPLILRRLDREERFAIPGTDRAAQPFFSPDGLSIGFLQDGRLRRVSVTGGDLTTLLDVSAMEGSQALNQVMYGATWTPRDQIVFATPRGLYTISANGGTPRRIASPDTTRGEWYFLQPAVVGDGSSVLVCVLGRDYTPHVSLVDVDDGERTSLGVTGREPKFVAPGRLVFADASGRLFTIGLDVRRRRTVGEAQQILENVALVESPPRAFVDVAPTGTIVYVGSIADEGRELVLVDRDGAARSLSPERMMWRHPRFSPDGRRLAVGVDAMGAGGDIWLLDLETRQLGRLTFDSLSIHPSWSQDGEFVVFPHPRLRDGRSAIFRVRADGSARPETLLVWPRQVWESELAADGRSLVFRDDNARTIRDVYVTQVGSAGVVRTVLGAALNERSIALAPSGGWMAYVSNANGRDEVYIRGLTGDSTPRPVSRSGGSEPRWSRDGTELFFRKGDTLFVAAVRLGATVTVSGTRALFTGVYQSSPHHALYDPAPNGRDFVLVRALRRSGGMAVHVVLHWFDQQGRVTVPSKVP